MVPRLVEVLAEHPAEHGGRAVLVPLSLTLAPNLLGHSPSWDTGSSSLGRMRTHGLSCQGARVTETSRPIRYTLCRPFSPKGRQLSVPLSVSLRDPWELSWGNHPRTLTSSKPRCISAKRRRCQNRRCLPPTCSPAHRWLRALPLPPALPTAFLFAVAPSELQKHPCSFLLPLV